MKLKMNRKTLNSIAICVMALLTVLALVLCGLLRPIHAGAETGLTVTDVDPAEIGLPEEAEPEEEPADDPADEPDDPAEDPTEEPTEGPTDAPTAVPTEDPTETPTEEPTTEPTDTPVQPTPVIMDKLFRIEIVTPKTWTNDKTRKVRVKVWQLCS